MLVKNAQNLMQAVMQAAEAACMKVSKNTLSVYCMCGGYLTHQILKPQCLVNYTCFLVYCRAKHILVFFRAKG